MTALSTAGGELVVSDFMTKFGEESKLLEVVLLDILASRLVVSCSELVLRIDSSDRNPVRSDIPRSAQRTSPRTRPVRF